MIAIENLRVDDEKARKICVKHINKHILSGINFFIDMCNDDGHYKRSFKRDACYAGLFPKGFQGDRFAEIWHIRELIESEKVEELSPSERYILMRCLASYYEDNEDKYTLEYADKVFSTEVLRAAMVPTSKAFENGDISLNIVPIEGIHDRIYVITKMAEAVHIFLRENPEEDDETGFAEILQMWMSDVENLVHYSSTCFEDEDYEFLGLDV